MAEEKRKRLDESFSGKEFQKGLTGNVSSEIDWGNIQVTPSGNIEMTAVKHIKKIVSCLKLAKESDAKGFSVNIEEDTIKNTKFREVLYTGKNMQLVLMSLRPGEDIGKEVHDVDQFFRIEAGKGKAIINKKSYPLSDGISLVVPAGVMHNILNEGDEDLKLYTIYAPPHHKDKTEHKLKSDAEKDSEHFDGTTSE